MDLVRQVVTAIAIFGSIIINILANALPFNGQNTGQISDRFQVYFTPAGYVFAIWGVIYVGLIAFGIYQALPAQRSHPALRRAGWMLTLGCVANVAWIFLWHYNIFPLTLVAMLVLLLTLIASYLTLGIGRAKVPAAERWTLHVPISIYLGWITVATIANVTALLYLAIAGGLDKGVPVTAVSLLGIGPETWTAIILVVAAVIASTVVYTRRDIAYGLVVVWAFIGIAVKWPAVLLVAGAAGVMAALIAVDIVTVIVRRRPA
jgi:benzodiazapine receptor